MEISKNLKIGLIVGGVAVAGLLIYGMIRKRKNAPKPEDDPEKKEDIKKSKVVYSKQGTNVRESPDKNSASWSKIDKAGVVLDVLEQYPPVVDGKYTWIFIQSPDFKHVGWVRSDAVSLTAPKLNAAGKGGEPCVFLEGDELVEGKKSVYDPNICVSRVGKKGTVYSEQINHAITKF
jgi:hypothetical protein